MKRESQRIGQFPQGHVLDGDLAIHFPELVPPHWVKSGGPDKLDFGRRLNLDLIRGDEHIDIPVELRRYPFTAEALGQNDPEFFLPPTYESEGRGLEG